MPGNAVADCDSPTTSLLFNKRSLEAAQRCNYLGLSEVFDRPGRLGLPLDLTTETREIIERTVIPAALMLPVDEADKEVLSAIEKYEGELQRRRIGLKLPDGVSYYDRFQAEKSLIWAIRLAAEAYFTGPYRSADFTSNPGFFHDAGLISGEPGNETLTVWRVTSRWDDERRARLDYPAILTWRESRAEYLVVQPVVVGSVGKDNCYEMPFTRRWVERGTSQKAWKASYEDASGRTKRLGKSWEKEAVEQVRPWINELLEQDFAAFGAVFPYAQSFQPSAQAQESAQYYLDMVCRHPYERNTRGCLFPNECPLFGHCWGGS